MIQIANLSQESKIVVASTNCVEYDSTATLVTLTEGHNTTLPDPSISGSYDIFWWNSTDYLSPSDDPFVEIVRCIAKVGNSIVIMRSQQQTLASPKNIKNKTYRMVLLSENENIPPSDNMNIPDTLSYYNLPQTHDNTKHSAVYQTASNVTSAISTHATLQATHGVTDAIVGTTNSQTLTNKTITDSTNNVTAKSLKSATTTIDVSASTAPTTGQVLTATSPSNANWQTPSSSAINVVLLGSTTGTFPQSVSGSNNASISKVVDYMEQPTSRILGLSIAVATDGTSSQSNNRAFRATINGTTFARANFRAQGANFDGMYFVPRNFLNFTTDTIVVSADISGGSPSAHAAIQSVHAIIV